MTSAPHPRPHAGRPVHAPPAGVSSRLRTSSLLVATALALLAALMAPAPAVADVVGSVGSTRIERLSGGNRIDTSVAISRETFPSAPTVVLARADQYADALVGAPLARKLGGPILLSDRDAVPAQVLAEIDRLQPSEVILLGGVNALSTAIQDDLSQRYTVRRISGTSRFATAAAVATELDGRTVFVTEGENVDPARGWPDALSVAPLAAHLGHPILLVNRDTLPAATAEAMAAAGTTEVIVAGGPAAVGEEVFGQLQAGRTARRLFGASRFETSAAIYDESAARGLSPTGRWVATGFNFPDALSAGPAVAASGELLLLADGTNLAGVPVIADRLRADCADLERIVLLGGTGVINGDAVNQLSTLLGSECGGTSGELLFPSGIDPSCDPAEAPTINELIADLDPAVDHDGDGFLTGFELNELAFDPTNPTVFNPLIADVPKLDLSPANALNITLTGEVENTRQTAQAVINTSEAAVARSSTHSREVSESHTASVSISGGTGGFNVEGGYEYNNTTTNGSSLTVDNTTSAGLSQEVSDNFGSASRIDGGDILFTIAAANSGSVDFQLDVLTLNIYRLTRSGDRLLLGTADTTSQPNLIAGAAPTNMGFTLTITSPTAAQSLATGLEALEFEVSSYTVEAIGAGDSRTDVSDFDAYQQSVRQNTATVAMDFGPPFIRKSYQVATTFLRDDEGRPAGLPLCTALVSIIGARLGTATGDFQGTSARIPVMVGTPPRVTPAVERAQDPDTAAYWVINISEGAFTTEPTVFGLDDVLLRSQVVVDLLHQVDMDGDGLSAVTEDRIGTSDITADTDDDGLADPAEITPAPFQAFATPFGDLPSVMLTSDPTARDTDRDGVTDGAERGAGPSWASNPRAGDSDRDDSLDATDPDDTLGTAFARAALAPTLYLPLDLRPTLVDGSPTQLWDYAGLDAAFTQSASACSTLAPGRDRFGNTRGAFRGGNGADRCTTIDAGPIGRPDGPGRPSPAGGPYTLSFWIQNDGTGSFAARTQQLIGWHDGLKVSIEYYLDQAFAGAPSARIVLTEGGQTFRSTRVPFDTFFSPVNVIVSRGVGNDAAAGTLDIANSGNYRDTQSFSLPRGTAACSLLIGYSATGCAGQGPASPVAFPALFDDVYLFDRVLSADDIATLRSPAFDPRPQ